MKGTDININGLEISPVIWADGIQAGIEWSDGFSKLLLPRVNFKNWIKNGEINHDSLDISFSDFQHVYVDKEYAEAIRNSYYYKVGFTNDYKVKEIKATLEELQKLPTYKDEKELFYIFKMQDLDHLVSLYFQHWLIFNEFKYWVKWQLYYDFIVKKSEKIIAGLYQYKWAVTLRRIESYTHAFGTVEQYKQFRDKLDDINKESKFVEEDFIKLRDIKK